jgi:hypothetical protein
MLRQYVVIPVYWGQSFLPDQHGSFSWLDMNGNGIPGSVLVILPHPVLSIWQPQ